jgi:hypothetical protein
MVAPMMVYQGKKHVSVIMQAHILVNTKQLKIPITSGRFDPTGKKILATAEHF